MIALGASLLAAPGALAHANLGSSDPAAGARLDTPPSEIVMHFTEQPELSLSGAQVLSSDGARVDDGNLRQEPDPRALVIGVKITAHGTYTVAWHCISKVDGHATAGSFAFGVGVNPSAPKKNLPTGPPPNPIEMTGRFFFIIGTVLVFGGALVALFVATGARRILRRYVIAGALAGSAGVIVLALAEHGTTHASWSVLFKLTIGQALIERVAALVLAAVAVAVAVRWWSYALALLFAAGAMFADVHAGHADATYSWIGGPVLEVLVQCVHFASAAVWMGGLGALLIAIRGGESEDKASAVVRYARFAALSIFVVAASGLYRAIGAIGSWHGVFHSGYGYSVIAKTVLLGLLALLAVRQRFFNLDKVRTTLAGLRRVGKAELTVGLAIFIATAILLGLSPPPPVSAASAPLVADAMDLGHTVSAHLVVSPGQAGINTFTVSLKTSERPQTVSLRFVYASGSAIGPSVLPLERRGNAWTATAANLSIQGLWNVTVVTQGATTSSEVPLEIATHCVTDAVPGPNGLILYTQTLSGGNSDSMYLDPGRVGHNEIHFTFFDPKGNELPVPDEPTITAWRPGTNARGLALRRFSAGHFIASARLGRGKWRFEADAVPKGTTQPLRACFEQTI